MVIPNYRQTVIAIIINSKGDILITFNKRINSVSSIYVDSHTYKFPQGGIEEGETRQFALVRELGEELGITANKDYVILQDDSSPVSYWFRNNDKPDFEIRLFPFLIKLLDDDCELICDPDEVSEFKWVKPENVKDLNLGIRKDAYLNILSRFNLIKI